MRLNIFRIDAAPAREPLVELVREPVRVDPLCRQCKYAHVERGYNENEERLLCGLNGGLNPLEFVVRECSDYVERRVPHVHVRVGFVRT